METGLFRSDRAEVPPSLGDAYQMILDLAYAIRGLCLIPPAERDEEDFQAMEAFAEEALTVLGCYERREVGQMAQREGKLTVEQALERIADGERIHTSLQSAAGLLLGADWDRARIEKALAEAEFIGESGPIATGMNHGLYFERADGRRYFVETKPSEEP